MLLIAAVVVGLVIGPWLGIIVDRLYSRESFAATHRCQVCRGELSGQTLIPVLSWAARCKQDASHRWWRYPALDISLAGVFALLAYHFGWSWQLGPYLAALAVMVMVSSFDLETHLLPDVVTVPLFGAVALGVLLLSTPQGHGDAIAPAFVGAGIYWLTLFLTHLVYPRGMGLGDVKLVPTLGLLLGWTTTSMLDAFVLVIWAFMIGNLVGGLTGLAFRATGFRTAVSGGPVWFDDDELAEDEGDDFDAEVPFGPFLVFGALAVILFSSRLL